MEQDLFYGPELIKNVVDDAAALFESSEDVYAVPRDLPRDYPVLYDPYLIPDAVFEAMSQHGVDVITDFVERFEKIDRLRFEAELLVQSVVKDWRSISRRRTQIARVLNTGGLTGFNPN